MSKANELENSGAAAIGVRTRALEEYLDRTVSEGLNAGGVIAVGTPDGTKLLKPFGWMDAAHSVRMPADAIFDLASVTKVVGTTTALALCMDCGLLDPDAPFTAYLPDYRGTLIEPVTIRDLSRHISGFPNEKPYDVIGEVVERVLDFSPVRPVGEMYEYSCGNYIMLGVIAERLLGTDLNTICVNNFFSPLEMTDTRWAPLPDPDPSHVIRYYESGTFGIASDPPARNANHPVGNAGLFSTVEDIAVFCRMILARGVHKGRRILSENVIDFIGTRPDTRSPVAFGWRVDSTYKAPSLSNRTLSHTGWTGNTVWIDPEKQLYVIVLTYRSTGDHDKAQEVRINIADLAVKCCQ